MDESDSNTKDQRPAREKPRSSPPAKRPSRTNKFRGALRRVLAENAETFELLSRRR